jgi:hypothetical protein
MFALGIAVKIARFFCADCNGKPARFFSGNAHPSLQGELAKQL